MRMTKREAERRAQGVCRAMPKWAIARIKDDGTVVFEIDQRKSVTYIEFSPEP